MAKTAVVYVRIEPEIKERAESILFELGIPASNAIKIFYKQIILHRGLPFDVKIPDQRMGDAGDLSDAVRDAELEKRDAELEKRDAETEQSQN